MKIASIFSFFLILFMSIFFTACNQKQNQKSDKTIKIGLAAVQTGSAGGEAGSKFLHGAEIAIDEWNEKGGLLSKRIEPLIRDDEGKPAQAVAVAHDLINQRVHAVIGHLNTGCTIPASDVYAEHHILQITLSTGSDVTNRGIQTLFRINGRDDQITHISADFAFHKLKLRKIAILHDKTAYGQGNAEDFKKSFETLGGTITSITGIAADEMDLRANILSIQKQNVEAVYWGGMYTQAGLLYNQMKQLGLDIHCIGASGCFDRELIDTIGVNPKNFYTTSPPDYFSQPNAQAFLRRYRERFGAEGVWSLYGYEAANVLFQAITEVGTMESSKVSAILKKKSFETLMGNLGFDEKGDLKQCPFIVWTIKEGKFVPYE